MTTPTRTRRYVAAVSPRLGALPPDPRDISKEKKQPGSLIAP